MTARTTLAIMQSGLVTSVGLSAAASCAAFRAKLSNPSETRFFDSGGQWIKAHQVPLARPWRGITRLAKMAAMAITEALVEIPRSQWPVISVILCVAETQRPGRMAGLDEQLFGQIQSELGVSFSAHSSIVPQGRVGVATALARARVLLADKAVQHVLVAAADSLLSWPTLMHFETADRLLTERNSNGFMPGEGAGALLVGRAREREAKLICEGIGFGCEAAHIDSEEPLRADGLSSAVKTAMAEAGCALHQVDFRITDNSGEQYYFKEAALAVARVLRVRRNELDLWHPAECTGEIGAVSGLSILSLAKAACEKRYGPGPNILAHMGNDAGQRAALALRFGTAT